MLSARVAPLVVIALLLQLLLTGCGSVSSDLFVPPALSACAERGDGATALRMVTWNIRAGLESSIDVIGDVLESMGADVIALQEVDRLAERSGGVDQAAVLAERLGMVHTFAAAREEGGGEFGNALLSRAPFTRAERVDLPGAVAGWEPRVAIDAELCAGRQPLRVLALHADVYPWVAADQARFVADLANDNQGGGVIVAGDLNQTPEAESLKLLDAVPLVDLSPRGKATSGWNRHIDYLFVDDSLTPGEGSVLDTDASDHVPVIADLRR